LIWKGKPSVVANDNRMPLALRLHRAAPLLASVALLAVALWVLLG
jgi:hypothetical protein